jgi:hypothetical protein
MPIVCIAVERGRRNSSTRRPRKGFTRLFDPASCYLTSRIRRQAGSRTGRSVAEKPCEIALGPTALPDLGVDTLEGLARDGTHRDLVCELFGLQKGMMSKDPHVPELVRHGRFELTVGQRVEETRLTIACSFPSGTVVELARSLPNVLTENEQTISVSSERRAEFRETRRLRIEEPALIFLDVRPNHHLP